VKMTFSQRRKRDERGSRGAIRTTRAAGVSEGEVVVRLVVLLIGSEGEADDVLVIDHHSPSLHHYMTIWTSPPSGPLLCDAAILSRLFHLARAAYASDPAVCAHKLPATPAWL